MLNKIGLCVAIVLVSGFTASAATRHLRASHDSPAYYDVIPGGLGDGCSPAHPSLCSNACPTDGSPCRVNGDEW
jgi:hypothetical protein